MEHPDLREPDPRPAAQPVPLTVPATVDAGASGASLPRYAVAGDAGADLKAAETTVVAAGGGRATVRTGVAIALPAGYAAFVHPRSGLAARHGVTVLNAPGTVDAGYRGEIRVTLLNTDPNQDFRVESGDRIAQLVVQKVEDVRWELVANLPASERGTAGFGSTGGFGAASTAAAGPPSSRPA